MLKDFTIANLLDLNETIAKDLFEGKTYPWEVLPEIGDFILKLGQTLSEEEYDHPSEDVWIEMCIRDRTDPCAKRNISFLRPCVEMWGTERRRNSFLYEGTGSGI